MNTLMAKDKPKRPVGRPQSENPTDIVSGRIHRDHYTAIEKLASHFRRSISAEIGIAVEDRLLANEQLLRKLGVWTAELDRLKEERQIS